MATQRRRGLELGVILLIYEVFSFGVGNVPPVTLLTIAGQVLLYTGYIDVPWEKHDVCISAQTVIASKDWKRFIISAFEHGDDMHLYYNMASYLIKGRSLEQKYASKNFALLLTTLTLLTSLMYVILGQCLTEITHNSAYAESCAIGFSGVIFALKVLTTWENPQERANIAGITMPGKYSAWVELILIHLLVPNSSFIGHLAGILAGIIYCKTFIGRTLDCIIKTITGETMNHTETETNNQQDHEYYHRRAPNSAGESNDSYDQSDGASRESRGRYGWRNDLPRNNNYYRGSGSTSYNGGQYGWSNDYRQDGRTNDDDCHRQNDFPESNFNGEGDWQFGWKDGDIPSSAYFD